MKKVIIVGGFLMFMTASAYAQNGNGYWNKLQKTHPETTLEALERISPAVSQQPSGQSDLLACRISLIYAGKVRDISEANLELMKEKGLNNGEIRQFRNEMLFTAAGKNVWLPVKSSLVGQLEIEVREEEKVLLYATVLKDSNPRQAQLTLLIEDFQVN